MSLVLARQSRLAHHPTRAYRSPHRAHAILSSTVGCAWMALSKKKQGLTHHMGKFAAAGFTAFCVLIVAFTEASAQTTLNVAAGHQLRVLWAYSLNPDCSSLGEIVVRITQ